MRGRGWTYAYLDDPQYRAWIPPSPTLPPRYRWTRKVARAKRWDLGRAWRYTGTLIEHGWTLGKYEQHHRDNLWRNINRRTNVKFMPALIEAIFSSNATFAPNRFRTGWYGTNVMKDIVYR